MRRMYFKGYGISFIGLIFSFFLVATTEAAITVPLNGSYTIKADGSGDFLSLKEAADTYNAYGLSGNAIFMIGSDLVETSMVEFKGTASNSQTYVLTITSDNTVQRKVSGNINGTLIKFTGANNIIIDGIVPVTESVPTSPLLAFINTYSTASANVRTISVEKDGTNSGQYVRIRNAEFTMANEQRGTGGGTVVYNSTDSLWINNCYVHNGYYGIYGNTSKFVQIKDNIVSENHAAGIYTVLFTTAVDVTISGNIVKDMTPTTGFRQKLYGIYVEHNAGSGTCDVSDNKVDNLRNQAGFECSTTVVWIYSAAAIKVTGNKISNVYNNSTSTGFSLQGMYIFANSLGAANAIQCHNNTIVNLSSESCTIALSVASSVSSTPFSFAKNCVISNITGKGIRPDLRNSIGIFAAGFVNLDANKIDNIKNTENNALASAIGIFLDRITVSTTSQISNNMVNDVAGRIGIGISVVGTVNLYHNSVRLTNKFNDSDEATLINSGDRFSTNISNIRLQNNLLSHEITSGLSQNFVLKRQSASGTSTILTSSNNRYYVVNSNIASVISDKAAQTGTVYPDLTSWATASTDNSLMVPKPAFVADDNLHLSAFPYNLQVPLISGITTDFDGDSRSQCGNTAGADINSTGQGPLNGIYRIGNAPTDDFSSLRQAAEVYNTCGLSGNTTFKVTSDLAEIMTSEFKGTAPGSDIWTLTITSDGTQHQISGSVNGPLVQFTAANNITIDGGVPVDAISIDGGINNTLLIFNNTNQGANVTALTVQKVSTSSQGKNVVVSNATFNTASTTGSSKSVDIQTNGSVMELAGCYLTNAAFGINMVDVYNGLYRFNVIRNIGKYGIANVVNPAAMNLVISNNDIKGISFTGMEAHLAGIAVLADNATGSLSVNHNKIRDIENLYASGNAENITARGIRLNFSGNLSCLSDSIGNITNTYGSYTQGILVNIYGSGTLNADSCVIDQVQGSKQVVGIFANARDVNATYTVDACSIDEVESSGSASNQYSIGICADGSGKVTANKIGNIISPGYYAFGIQTQWTSGNNANYLLMSNNMIYDIKGKYGYGIYADQSLLNQRILQNTISLAGSGATGTSTVNVGFGRTSSNDLRIRNNILVNTDLTGTALLFDGDNVNVGDNVFADNKYKVSSGMIGSLAAATYNDLDAWNALTGDNSVFSNPVFISSSDLHLTGASLTDAILMSPFLDEVTTDIDGDPRTHRKNTAGADNTDMEISVQDASLKDLQLDGVTIDDFDPAKISYTLTLPCNVERATLLGIPNDPAASVSGNGTFSLQPGDNYFAITVTAQDLETKMTYTVNIIRDCQVPRIIKDLEDAIVCVGGSHTWSIEVEGENLTYEWYCGFNRISGANTNTITISDAKLTDYERYYVIIRSDYNGFQSSKYSKRVKLWVSDYLPSHLKFAEYPDPAVVGKTYHVKVDGYPDVTKYVWYYSQEGVSFSPEIGKETENETWATFGTLSAGTGTLNVTIEHPCGTRELMQSITVQHPTGIDDVTANVVTVYPNPTLGVLKVYNTTLNHIIRVLDVTGSLKATYKTQEGFTTIDLTGYAKGTYVIQYNGKAYKVIRK